MRVVSDATGELGPWKRIQQLPQCLQWLETQIPGFEYSWVPLAWVLLVSFAAVSGKLSREPMVGILWV